MEKIDITTGLYIPKQVFLDPKANILNEATLQNLGVNNVLAFTYPKGIVIKCIEENSYWEWREREGGDGPGLMNTDFVYPANIIVDLVDYSNKIYNFFTWIDKQVDDLEIAVENIYQPNVLIRSVSPGIVGKTYTYGSGNYEAMINKVRYINPVNFVTTITDATPNYKRIDLVYITINGVIAKLEGVESLTDATAPALPVNSLALSYISVFGTTVTEIIQPSGDPLKEDKINKQTVITGYETSNFFYASINAITFWFKNNALAWLGSWGTAIADADTLLVGKSGVLGTRTWLQVKTALSLIFQVIDEQIEIGASTTVQNAWKGKTILFTANCTITVPTTLDPSLMFPFRTLTGVTVTWAITAPFTWEVTPVNTLERTVGHFMRRGSTNTIILDQ